MTLAWEGPGDGTTPYSNGMQRSVDKAVANGITWVNSAGNEADATWFGNFTDTDGDGLHEFSGTDNCNNYALYDGGQIYAARFTREVELKIQLRWDDRWGGASRDLDLILAKWNEFTQRYEEYAISESEQSGGTGHIPFEYIVGSVPAGSYCLAVGKYAGTAPSWIQLQDFTGRLLQHHTLHHSIGNPAESANPGLLAVGATSALDTNTIEPYSSQGPAPDGRRKPDIVGVARGQSVSYRSSERPDGRWIGTSQASPHVAGLAALVKQNYPNYTPQQIAQYLKTHAEERGAAGADNVWGYGFARLLASDVSPQPTPTLTPSPTSSPTPSPTPTPTPTPSPTPTPEPTSTITFGDLNWHSVMLQNRIAQYIAEIGYGYSTDVTLGAVLPLFQGLRRGEVDVLMEVWLPSQEDVWEEALSEGSVSSPGRSFIDWQSAFVIPKYLQQQYPDLDSVEDLKEERFKSLFATDDTRGKARLVSCVIGWVCETVNAKQIEGYGLSDHVFVVNPGDTASLNADLTNAYENQEPWLGFQWGTNEPALLHDLVRLEEPAYSDECWSTTMACAYGDSTALIGINADLSGSAPDFVDALKEWDFNVEEVYRPAFRWQAADPNANIEAAAMWWLRENNELWSDWVTDAAAAAIQAALDNGEIPDGWPNAPTTGSCVEPLPSAGSVSGAWDGSCDSENNSGSYARYYTFTLTEQSRATVTLESREDTYLFLLDGHGKDGTERAQNNDHSAEADCTANLARNTDSCVTETLPAGDYTIEATTRESETTGNFTLTVEIGSSTTPPPPPTPVPTPTPSGVCSADLVVSPGESCTYPGSTTQFIVSGAGIGRIEHIASGDSIDIRVVLRATKQSGGGWLIEEIGGSEQPQPTPSSTPTPSPSPSPTPTPEPTPSPGPSPTPIPGAAPDSPANQRYVWQGSTTVVSWDSVSGADYYNIYYDDFFDDSCRLSSSGSPSFCEELATNVTATSYIHTDPDEDENYYWVVACNSDGCSDIDSANPAEFVDTRTGGPSNQRYVWQDSTTVVSWDAVSGANYYNIYYHYSFDSDCQLSSLGNPIFCDELATNVTATSYTHTDPDEDATNYYWVVACNNGGCSDIDSDNPARLEGSVPVFDLATSVRVVDRTSNSLTARWYRYADTHQGAHFELQRSTSPDSGYNLVASNLTGNEHQDGGLSPNTTYYYRIRGCSEVGCSPFSDAKGGITESDEPVDIPSSPTGIKGRKVDVSFGTDYAIVTWDAVQGATYYQVYKNSEHDRNISAPQTRYEDHESSFFFGFRGGTYTVRACNKAGCSAFTSGVTVLAVSD